MSNLSPEFSKVPIPNVCITFDVGYVNTFDMLEAQQRQFCLAKV